MTSEDKGRLTFVSGNRAVEDLDEVSKKILATGSGTSIFDPVLCELSYIWYSPQGGVVLDPFAGGSVRGIVASKLGREYIGIELRQEQVDANRVQGDKICGAPDPDEMISVQVSGKWLRHCFPCSEEYINDVCKGECCEGANEILVSLLPEEVERQEEMGLRVIDNRLIADPKTEKCPHKETNGFCGIHLTPDKPFGCIASPFTLNKGNTLIVRNRYMHLKCFDKGPPAYVTFKASLVLLFGEEEADRIAEECKKGVETIPAQMSAKNVKRLRYLDGIKQGGVSDEPMPIWHCGDSQDIVQLCDGVEADLIFTCPPYADLEKYSDDPRDISTMDYKEFIKSYRDIIKKSCSLLKDNRFAVIVVGEVRDKKSGNYYNFVGDTITAFLDAGLHYYNEKILITAVGSLPLRAGKQFASGRKIGKTHQNVLVFVKGDGKKAAEACGDVDVMDLSEFEGDT